MLSARESAGDMFSSTICDVTCRGTVQFVESADVSEALHSRTTVPIEQSAYRIYGPHRTVGKQQRATRGVGTFGDCTSSSPVVPQHQALLLFCACLADATAQCEPRSRSRRRRRGLPRFGFGFGFGLGLID